MGITRRDFVKGTILAGAAITAVPTILVRKSPAEWAKKIIPGVPAVRFIRLLDGLGVSRAGV